MSTHPTLVLRAMLAQRAELRLQMPPKGSGLPAVYVLQVLAHNPAQALGGGEGFVPIDAELCLGEALPSTYIAGSARAQRLQRGTVVLIEAAHWRLCHTGRGRQRQSVLRLTGVTEIREAEPLAANDTRSGAERRATIA